MVEIGAVVVVVRSFAGFEPDIVGEMAVALFAVDVGSASAGARPVVVPVAAEPARAATEMDLT